VARAPKARISDGAMAEPRPAVPQPPAQELVKPSRNVFDFSVLIRWWNGKRTEWFYRAFLWWYAERARHS